MTFTIIGSKNGQIASTVRISPTAAIEKARALEDAGWLIHITNSAGRQFAPLDFDRLSSFADEVA